MTTRQEQRSQMAAEAEAEIAEARHRSHAEGWTFELRNAYLSAHHRLELSRDLGYWGSLEQRDTPSIH